MTELLFSSSEAHQCANRIDNIEAPRLDDRDCGKLIGPVKGSDVAAGVHQNLEALTDFHLELAGRGLEALPALLRTVAGRFDGQDRVNADQLQSVWTDAYGPLSGHRFDEAPPQVPATRPAGYPATILDLLVPRR